jgi:hypothetical protein
LDKIGEQQIQRLFSEYLGREVRKNLGDDFPFACGEFNGMQDRKYADYFSGVNACNVLIEFKEFFSEIKDEKRKVLRRKLCHEIPEDLIDISYATHHISWREKSEESIILGFQRYLSKVCPLFEVNYDEFETLGVNKFLNDFINKDIGSDNSLFSDYIEYLAKIAGDEGAGFFGLFISFDSESGMKTTIFKDMSQLIELVNSNASEAKNEQPKPKGPSNSGGMSFGM